jgi:hypothetical protein
MAQALTCDGRFIFEPGPAPHVTNFALRLVLACHPYFLGVITKSFAQGGAPKVIALKTADSERRIWGD